MTKKLLRDTLKEAQEKEQLGLLVWANWPLWDDCASDMKPGDKSYDFLLSQISKKEEGTIYKNWCGFNLPGIIGISVEKLSSSDESLHSLLDACQKGNYEGPITLIPLNEVAVSCVEE